MRLDDKIEAILNEVTSVPMGSKRYAWFIRNFQQARDRAKDLEDLADALVRVKHPMLLKDEKGPTPTSVCNEDSQGF